MSDIIRTAVRSGIPIVAVETDDPLNSVLVLSSIIDKQAHPYPTTDSGKLDLKAALSDEVYIIRTNKIGREDWEGLYGHAATKNYCVVAVNQEKPQSCFFEAGVMTCPPALTEKFAKKFMTEDSDEFETVVSSLSGLSYKSMSDLLLLCMEKHGHASPEALRETRRMLFADIRGLRQEDTNVLFYKPNKELEEWLAVDGVLFQKAKHKAMRPRGLILDGPPGTGKTMGAKFIAKQLGLSLYRLDVSGGMSKWLGESEKNFRQALSQVDQCGPCVMLVDECEKLFSQQGGDSGTSSRILSTLLWWLQEHDSKVLTVMTTNKAGIIPKELIRPGRIDAKMDFGYLSPDDALSFMQAIAKQASELALVPKERIVELHTTLFSQSAALSHAALNGYVMAEVKKSYLQTLKD